MEIQMKELRHLHSSELVIDSNHSKMLEKVFYDDYLIFSIFYEYNFILIQINTIYLNLIFVRLNCAIKQ